ncbi:MAG: universal stress protein [Sandaracinaceae bacterium]
MSDRRPLLVAVPFDHETQDILTAAVDLAQRMDAPLSLVHAVGWRPFESEAHLQERLVREEQKVEEQLAPFVESGARIEEIHVERGRAADVVVDRAQEVHAHMVITGGATSATLSRWLAGSTAEAIVRHSLVPVMVVRGPVPFGHLPLLCPVDLSPQSRLGFTLALRMARLYRTPLRVLTVIPESAEGFLHSSDLYEELSREESKAKEQVEEFLNAHDLADVQVEPKVSVGRPAERIVEEASDAGLLVIGSRGFDYLRPGTLGTVTERVLRFSRTSALTVRDLDPEREAREEGLRRVAELKTRADAHLDAGEPQRALPLLQLAAVRAPFNASIQESYARALDSTGRSEEAAERRRLAEAIRGSFT